MTGVDLLSAVISFCDEVCLKVGFNLALILPINVFYVWNGDLLMNKQQYLHVTWKLTLDCLRHKYAERKLLKEVFDLQTKSRLCCSDVLFLSCSLHVLTGRERWAVPDHNEDLISAPGSWRVRNSFSSSPPFFIFLFFFSHIHT